jgi:hypothetical protein
VRPGGTTRRKWRIPDEKGESCQFLYSSSEGANPRLYRLRTDHLALVNKIDYILTHTGFMGSANLVTLMVAELDDTQLYLTDGIGIVFRPLTD